MSNKNEASKPWPLIDPTTVSLEDWELTMAETAPFNEVFDPNLSDALDYTLRIIASTIIHEQEAQIKRIFANTEYLQPALQAKLALHANLPEGKKYLKDLLDYIAEEIQNPT